MKAKIVSVSGLVPSTKGNVVLIGLNNGTTLVRTEGQFSKDLDKSFLKQRDVKDLINGEIEGDAKHHKAGEKYLADENSSAVKAGTAKIGDELAYEKEGYRVEGFLTFQINPKADMLNRAAQASAELMQEIFGFASAPKAEVVTEVAPKEEIPTV